jgi:hypothetical protein
MWLNVLTMLVFSIAVYIVRRQSIAARETLEVLRAEHGAG